MKSRILLLGLLLILIVGCRRKSTDDYNYYKPYTKDSTAIDSTKIMADTTQVKITEPVVEEKIVKGVDLKDNYFIVVASYTVEDFALGKKKDLIEQGYKPEIFMTDDDGWYKLAVESYKTLGEAKNALIENVNRGGIFANSRIVFKKNK